LGTSLLHGLPLCLFLDLLPLGCQSYKAAMPRPWISECCLPNPPAVLASSATLSFVRLSSFRYSRFPCSALPCCALLCIAAIVSKLLPPVPLIYHSASLSSAEKKAGLSDIQQFNPIHQSRPSLAIANRIPANHSRSIGSSSGLDPKSPVAIISAARTPTISSPTHSQNFNVVNEIKRQYVLPTA
jgi:hypothetical protein